MDLSAGPAIKICGLKRPQDVRLAVALGAWAVGFILAPSPRQVVPQEVRALAEEARAAARDGALPAPLVVGVFGDATPEEVVTTARQAGIDAVQLHGRRSPSPAAVKAVARAAAVDPDVGPGEALLVIQAVPVPSSGVNQALVIQEAAEALRAGADVILFDTLRGTQFGGSGQAFPWEVVAELGSAGSSLFGGRPPVLVAGGIGPDNVAAALERSGAWGVDVSSGIEVAPGEKDPGLMTRLFEEARAAGLRRRGAASRSRVRAGCGGGARAPESARASEKKGITS